MIAMGPGIAPQIVSATQVAKLDALPSDAQSAAQVAAAAAAAVATLALKGSGTSVALGSDGTTAVLAQTLTGLGASKKYQATLGVRVGIYTNADHAVGGDFDCKVGVYVVTDGSGVATVTLRTTAVFDSSLVSSGVSTAVALLAATAGGFTISVARPAGVACTAWATWWVAEWKDVT